MQFKNQFLSCTCHTFSAQNPQRIGKHRERTKPSLQKVILDSATSQSCSTCFEVDASKRRINPHGFKAEQNILENNPGVFEYVNTFDSFADMTMDCCFSSQHLWLECLLFSKTHSFKERNSTRWKGVLSLPSSEWNHFIMMFKNIKIKKVFL